MISSTYHVFFSFKTSDWSREKLKLVRQFLVGIMCGISIGQDLIANFCLYLNLKGRISTFDVRGDFENWVQ